MTIRVLVVDDSVVVRRSVADILGAEDDIEVVGTASDGLIGLRRIEEHHPDIVTLDVEMPRMDGLDTLREIRQRWPELPVVMYSTLTERGAETTFEALALGAVDYATKPEGATDRQQVTERVRQSLLPVVRLWGRRRAAPPPKRVEPGIALAVPARESARVPAPASAPGRDVRPVTRRGPRPHLVVVGVSTGGPDALARMVPALPADLSVPVVVVQHMPPVFTQLLAARLDRASAISVSEAVDGEVLQAGHVYIAPGGRHTEVRQDQDPTSNGLRLVLTDGPPENSCRPAADVLFRSAVAAVGSRLLGVVLTGMGQDARLGARLIRDAGGDVIAQDEPSSVVWGMPGFVARDETASSVLPLDDIAARISSVVSPLLIGSPS